MFVNWVMGKPANTHGNLSHENGDVVLKQDAAHEPECSHVKHFCETSDLNSLVHFSQCTVGCGIQKRAECKLWGVKTKVIRDHLEHRKVDHLEHRIT